MGNLTLSNNTAKPLSHKAGWDDRRKKQRGGLHRDACVCGSIINNKGGAHFNGGRKDCWGAGATGSLQGEKNVRSLASGTAKLNHRWIKDFNVKETEA